MAFQTIQGRDVFVVDLVDFPPPMPIHAGDSPELALYATALMTAIRSGVIKEAGKYAIEITDSGKHWNAFRIDE